MRSRLRSFDSKITFFAFADIITAVSGMLIFITLLLATDLGQPISSSSHDADPTQRRLDETLRQQAEMDSENRSLQALLGDAEAAPALEKLESDVSRLRIQFAEEKQKQGARAAQLVGSRAAMEARDNALGLGDLKSRIQSATRDTEAITQQGVKAGVEMAKLEQNVARAQAQLLTLRQREGQIWLIPDRSSTTKEPILVTVTRSGANVERFDRPEQRKQWDKANSESSFRAFLDQANKLNEYVVFLVKPSGIELFESLKTQAQSRQFDVGYDAVEENREVHFSTPPPPATDEPSAPAAEPAKTSQQSAANSASTTNLPPIITKPKSETTPSEIPRMPQAQTKSWWRRFREWIGLG